MQSSHPNTVKKSSLKFVPYKDIWVLQRRAFRTGWHYTALACIASSLFSLMHRAPIKLPLLYRIVFLQLTGFSSQLQKGSRGSWDRCVTAADWVTFLAIQLSCLLLRCDTVPSSALQHSTVATAGIWKRDLVLVSFVLFCFGLSVECCAAQCVNLTSQRIRNRAQSQIKSSGI